MRIVYVLKDNLNHRPPILSTVRSLIDLGHEIILLSLGISEDTRREFEAHGCRCVTLSIGTRLGGVPKIGNFLQWWNFRRQVFKVIEREKFDILWIGSADATLALGDELLRYPYVLQIQELYDIFPFYRDRLGRYMHGALKVFVPETVRAHIFRAWYQLKETPVVLPNKPFGHPRERNLPITDPAAAEAFAKIPGDAKILFYQGNIYKDRDLSPVAEAISSFNGKIVLAVQGKIFNDDYCRNFFRNYNVYYVPFVPAPHHLEVTSNVDFGLVSYEHNQMNNEFCAPNKIWEYSGFGLPMLGNDVFGLRDPFERYGIGVNVNFDRRPSGEAIQNALTELLEKESCFAKNATAFFDALDTKRIIADTLAMMKFDGRPGRES